MNITHLLEIQRSEAELAKRIETHLSGSDDKRKVALVWAGYLVGLGEWRGIGHGIMGDLFASMPMEDRLEIARIAEGFHDNDDEE